MSVDEIFSALKRLPNLVESPTKTTVRKACDALLKEGRLQQARRDSGGKPGKPPAGFRIATDKLITSRTSAEIILLLYHRASGPSAMEDEFVAEVAAVIAKLDSPQTLAEIQRRIDEDCVKKEYFGREGEGSNRVLKVRQHLVDLDLRYLEAIRLSLTKKQPVSQIEQSNESQQQA